MSTETELTRAEARPASALTRWLWPAAAVVLVAALVALGALWWSTRAPAENDQVVTFDRDMTAHHMQAVQMAIVLRDRSQDPELRQLALDILLTQQAQIGQMQGWLEVWGLPFAGSQPPMTDHSIHGPDMPVNMGMATPEEVDSLSSLPVAEAEVQFLKVMIRHHAGGIYMANAILQHTQRPEVVRLAQSIVTSQEKEIQYMENLLTARGASSSP